MTMRALLVILLAISFHAFSAPFPQTSPITIGDLNAPGEGKFFPQFTVEPVVQSTNSNVVLPAVHHAKRQDIAQVEVQQRKRSSFLYHFLDSIFADKPNKNGKGPPPPAAKGGANAAPAAKGGANAAPAAKGGQNAAPAAKGGPNAAPAAKGGQARRASLDE